MYLKAILVEAAKAAVNGNQYKVVTFQELSEYAQLPGSNKPTEVKTNATPHKRTLWSNQDGLFSNMETEDVTFGTIKRFEVDQYEITNAQGTRVASSFTGVQFRGETDATTCMRYGKKLRLDSPAITAESVVNAALEQPAIAVADPIPA